MYRDKKVSVILPCYNEELNIKNCVNQFFDTMVVDEVIVVDNNSKDTSEKRIKETKATYVLETIQGYGAALQKGLKEATGDLLVMVEPDATFKAQDIHKLLDNSYFDVVFGTRTKTFVKGAKMTLFLLWGNIFVAKLLQYIRKGCKISDVGCTYKLINRKAYEQIKDSLTVTKSHFSPEFMMRCFQKHLRCIEIPVWYGPRIGESKITSNTWKAFKLGLRMIYLIIKG